MADRPFVLADGARVRFRPIAPEDGALVRRAFDRLSERTRYQRFFSPVHELGDATLEYLTDIDHRDHEALVALDEDSGELVGVARYVRVEDGVAEPAITVVDDWQGRGLSGELLRRLVTRALQEDVHHFRAWVLRDNPKAVRVLRRLGDTTSTGQGTAVQLDIALDEPERLEGPITELVRAAAQGALAPPMSLWRRVSSVLRVGLEGRTQPWPGAAGLGDAIVVGADRSDDGRRALRYAVGLAEVLDAPLHAVAAYRPLLDPRGRADDLLRGIDASLRDRAVDAQVHLRQGDPAEALIEIAEDTLARTIVVGPGGGGARRYLVGSTADKVARHAPCNVLIVRA